MGAPRGADVNELACYDYGQGDTVPYPGTTPGYQTIFVAGRAAGTMDFGTAVLLNMAGHQAASTAAVQITTDSVQILERFLHPAIWIQGHTESTS